MSAKKEQKKYICQCKVCSYKSDKWLDLCPNCNSDKSFEAISNTQREEIPDQILGTLEFHKTMTEYFETYENIPVTSKSMPNGGGTYKDLYDYTFDRNVDDIIKGQNPDVTNEQWFGRPILRNREEALLRKNYLRMDDYQDVYERVIKPRIQDILKNSRASLEMPVMKYNDLGLGIFDFNKASTGLLPTTFFYSLKEKEIVDANLVETYKQDNKYKYKLKSDGSPVVSVPKILSDDKELIHKIYQEVYEGANIFDLIKKYNVRIGGVDAFTSTIKKTYLLKEKTKKLRNAIRLFVKIGDNCTILYDTYKWCGYLAVGLEELLSTMGYAVNVYGIFGTQTQINYKQDGNLERGYRFHAINLKRFDESLDKGSTLYMLCDQSFFRVKVFDLMIREYEEKGDYIGRELGYPANDGTLKNLIFREIGIKDKMWNKKGVKEQNSQFLYYIIADVHSEQELSQKILDIALDIINLNEEARYKYG